MLLWGVRWPLTVARGRSPRLAAVEEDAECQEPTALVLDTIVRGLECEFWAEQSLLASPLGPCLPSAGVG